MNADQVLVGNFGRTNPKRDDVAQSIRRDPSSTFVIRLRAERSSTGLHWRGQIDHLQSGERAAFRSVEGLLAFIHRLTGWQEEGRRAEKRR